MQRLPPGPHGLPPELVERNQRERLIAAMAEVCAEKGYGSTSVADVTRRAGVSTASFYRQFEDKRECLLASFEELFERLWEEIEGACAGAAEPEGKLRSGLATVASLLAGDPPTARLLTIEILAIGPDGVRLQQGAIERLETLLRGVGDPGLSADSAFPSREWIAVSAAVAVAAQRVAAGESPSAEELEAVFVAVGISL